jgi:acyl CoA:acetate/3-ketoacid CoA transferase beta subunit
MATSNYTTNELMAVTASRCLKDGQNVLVGLGLPQVASLLAKNTHAPNLNIVYEIGVVNAESVDPAVGIADPRLWYRGEYFTNSIGTLGRLLQKGLVDVGFLGALQIDAYGNINSTQVNEGDRIRHINGSGGAADIATFSKNLFAIAKHEKRKIVRTLDYLTSAGYLEGGASREKAGLPLPEDVVIITNLCMMSLNKKENRLEVKLIHPGVSEQSVIENTGFDIRIAADARVTDTPGEEELRVLRTKVDPLGIFIK